MHDCLYRMEILYPALCVCMFTKEYQCIAALIITTSQLHVTRSVSSYLSCWSQRPLCCTQVATAHGFGFVTVINNDRAWHGGFRWNPTTTTIIIRENKLFVCFCFSAFLNIRLVVLHGPIQPASPSYSWHQWAVLWPYWLKHNWCNSLHHISFVSDNCAGIAVASLQGFFYFVLFTCPQGCWVSFCIQTNLIEIHRFIVKYTDDCVEVSSFVSFVSL